MKFNISVLFFVLLAKTTRTVLCNGLATIFLRKNLMLLQENNVVQKINEIIKKKKQLQKLNDSNYKSKLNLSEAITEIMKPIFQDLSENELREKFLHGQLQNTNEPFNQLICKR